MPTVYCMNLVQRGNRIIGTISVPKTDGEIAVNVSCVAECTVVLPRSTSTYRNIVLDRIPVQTTHSQEVDFEMPMLEYSTTFIECENGDCLLRFTIQYQLELTHDDQVTVCPFEYHIMDHIISPKQDKLLMSTQTIDGDSSCCRVSGPVSLTLRCTGNHCDLFVDNRDNPEPIHGRTRIVYRAELSLCSFADTPAESTVIEREFDSRVWQCLGSGTSTDTIPITNHSMVEYGGERGPWPMQVLIDGKEYAEPGTFTVWYGVVVVARVDNRPGQCTLALQLPVDLTKDQVHGAYQGHNVGYQ